MLFHSWSYLAFLVLVVALHWSLPHRLRVPLLGAMSLLFYACWRWEFVFLMLFSVCVDWGAARRIHAARGAGHHARARRWLWASLATNVGLLVFFKYTYFLHDNVRLVGALAGAEFPALQDLGVRIVLPLGISFYTFQTISYTVDVYRGVTAPASRFGAFLTYVTFWPQLVAGPILRAAEVIPQLEARRRLRADDVAAGLLLVLSGLVKKTLLADNLAPIVERAFAADPAALTVFDVVTASSLFGFQIYLDFSGYSDVAIGSARLCGIRFPANFDWPYLATSPRMFWQRWHISLSAWIRDYLYLPLTRRRGDRESRGGIAVATTTRGRSGALFAVWFVMGLWHGASWTFAVWGLYHAALVWLYRAVPPLRHLAERAPALGWAIWFPLAMLGWIPFRAESLAQARSMLAAFADPSRWDYHARLLRTEEHLTLALLVGSMLLLAAAARLRERIDPPAPLVWAGTAAAAAGATALLIAFLEPARRYLYFQF